MKKMTKREKVILGVSIGLGVVAVGTTGYFGVKCYSLNRENNLLQKTNDVLNDKVTTLMEAASEGVFEEAISTVNNKLNHRNDRKKYLLEQLSETPNDIQTKKTLEKVETELSNLLKRKDKFTKAQSFYAIADTIEEEL